MKVCRRCLYTTLHPLGLVIDREGICSGCRVHEEKDLLNWDKRWKKLEKIVQGFRRRSGSNYDCVVPVSGARDSFFIVHTVKKRLGLNPLLVTYNKHYNTAVGIRNLARLRTAMNCDLFTKVVDPERVKKITRATFRRWGSIYWHCLAGQTAFPVQIAVKMKIPLIIWGHHQGLDQVGMFSHLDEVEMSRRYRRDHDLFRQESETLLEGSDFISKSDLQPFQYPHDNEIAKVGVRGIYLGNYLRWDSKIQHESMMDMYNYEAVRQNRTFDTYNDVDCWVYSDLHDYIKWVKWGYGKATDHAVRELRFERLCRKKAAEIALFYEKKEPKHFEIFLDWLGITKKGFHFILEQHRNKYIWQISNKDKKIIYSEIWKKNNKTAGRHQKHKKHKPLKFRIREARPIYDMKKGYILIGKGEYSEPSLHAESIVCA